MHYLGHSINYFEKISMWVGDGIKECRFGVLKFNIGSVHDKIIFLKDKHAFNVIFKVVLRKVNCSDYKQHANCSQ